MNYKKIINIENINNFLLAILICVPMISFIVNINNIIPYTNIVVLIILLFCNFKKMKNIQINIKTLVYIMIFVVMILINIMMFRYS